MINACFEQILHVGTEIVFQSCPQNIKKVLTLFSLSILEIQYIQYVTLLLHVTVFNCFFPHLFMYHIANVAYCKMR